ncbi:MAG: hypothetical protein AABY64_05050 [Bdellovibrionota bacterium]
MAGQTGGRYHVGSHGADDNKAHCCSQHDANKGKALVVGVHNFIVSMYLYGTNDIFSLSFFEATGFAQAE